MKRIVKRWRQDWDPGSGEDDIPTRARKFMSCLVDAPTVVHETVFHAGSALFGEAATLGGRQIWRNSAVFAYDRLFGNCREDFASCLECRSPVSFSFSLGYTSGENRKVGIVLGGKPAGQSCAGNLYFPERTISYEVPSAYFSTWIAYAMEGLGLLDGYRFILCLGNEHAEQAAALVECGAEVVYDGKGIDACRSRHRPR